MRSDTMLRLQMMSWIHSSLDNNGTNFTMGRLYSLDAVLMETTRTNESSPGCNSMTRASFHLIGGSLSSFINTRSPICKLSSFLVHLFLCCNVVRYSFFHLFQKCWQICCVNCHLDKQFILTNLKSGSGTAVNGCPIKKCPGVKAVKSFGSLDMAHNGLELS